MDEFVHVRSIIGIILGLSLAHLINGSVFFIQHPGRKKFYIIHFLWVVYVFLLLIHFWWWEINLRLIVQWNFAEYLFLISYILLFFMLCAILYPNDLKEYKGYEDYFFSRKNWFFSILLLCFLADVIDTAIKGGAYFSQNQLGYSVRTVIHVILCSLAIVSVNKKFHSFLAVFFIIYEIIFILQFFSVE